MPEPDDKDALIEVMSPLVDGLYSSLDRALELARQHFVEFDMDGPEYEPGVHHLARAHWRRLLTGAHAAGDLGRWQVASPQPNLQIALNHEQITLRLLRPAGRTVPPPGPNSARRAYYSNTHDNLLGLHGSNLLGLWSMEPTTDEASVRVVRPIGTWRWGQRAKIDIDVRLPRRADDLTQLEFIPTDDRDVALPFEEPDVGEGTDADDG